MTTTVGTLFRTAIAGDAARPLLTFYDDATGERIELSGTTLANWVAKTANLLIDEIGLAPGDCAAVTLPPHWQTAGLLLGCWTAGIAVVPTGGDVTFAETPGHGGYLLGFAPMAMPMRAVPPGHLDYIAEVRPQGDSFSPYSPVTPGMAATDTLTHAALCDRATTAARGLGPTDRVLIDGDVVTDPVDWLLAPLSAGASIVLTRRTDPTKLPARRESERVTHG